MENRPWAFVDYENIGSLEKTDLRRFDRLFVFLGANQHRLSFGPQDFGLAPPLTVLKVKTSTKNNVDFHLSYFLGQQDAQAPPCVPFVVLSRDAGYDPLIHFIKARGRACERSAPTAAKKASAAAKPQAAADQGMTSAAAGVKAQLVKNAKAKRPKSEQSLKNWVRSHLGAKGSLNNNCVFWGVEAPVRQGAERGAYSLYATLFATQPGGMDRRSKMGSYC